MEDRLPRQCENFLCSCREGDRLLQFKDLLDLEGRLEGGEELLECGGLLGIGSFLGGEGLMEGAVLVVCEGLLGGFL